MFPQKLSKYINFVTMHHTDTLANYDFVKKSLNPRRSKYGLIRKPHSPPNKKMSEKALPLRFDVGKLINLSRFEKMKVNNSKLIKSKLNAIIIYQISITFEVGRRL